MSQYARSIFKSLIVLLAVLAPAAVHAQGTPMPWAIPQFFDSNGDPLTSGKLCVFAAGTSTLKDTYTTAALNVTNANPVVMNAGGWPSQSSAIVGIFLTPGESYKFVLKASNATTCVPDTGTTIWSVDQITAVPVDSGAIDIDGTAGEALTAGDVVYLSDGSGSKTVGRWYKADADFTYASSDAPFIGMVPTSISSAATGTIRIKGLVTVAGVSSSVVYYVSATAGGLTSTPPTLIRNVGVGYTSTSILLSPANSGKLPTLSSAYLYSAIQLQNVVSGRLSAQTNTCVTTADVTAATTIYFTPGATTSACRGNQIALYNTTSSVWQVYSFAQLSIALGTDAANTPYDVYAYINTDAVAIERLAWTNTTTRATALGTQDGIFIKSGDASRRYLGTYSTTAVIGQTEDSFAKRLVWSYANRVRRAMRVTDATNTWDYTTATWRQAGANAANQLAVVIGVAEDPVHVDVRGLGYNDGGSVYIAVAAGYDSTTAPTTGNVGMSQVVSNAGFQMIVSTLEHYPAIGSHTYVWLEWSTASSTTHWAGDNNLPTLFQAGISGWVMG